MRVEIWMKENLKIKGWALYGLMILFCHELRGVTNPALCS